MLRAAGCAGGYLTDDIHSQCCATPFCTDIATTLLHSSTWLCHVDYSPFDDSNIAKTRLWLVSKRNQPQNSLFSEVPKTGSFVARPGTTSHKTLSTSRASLKHWMLQI
jgi:hypothetical protein